MIFKKIVYQFIIFIRQSTVILSILLKSFYTENRPFFKYIFLNLNIYKRQKKIHRKSQHFLQLGFEIACLLLSHYHITYEY
jgi:hypothetical protein